MNVKQLEDLGAIQRPLNVVINCRPDRVERNGQMGEIIPRLGPETVFLIGHPTKSAKDAIPDGFEGRIVDLGGDRRDAGELTQDILAGLDARSSMVAIGNIHGQGELFLEHLGELPLDEDQEDWTAERGPAPAADPAADAGTVPISLAPPPEPEPYGWVAGLESTGAQRALTARHIATIQAQQGYVGGPSAAHGEGQRVPSPREEAARVAARMAATVRPPYEPRTHEAYGSRPFAGGIRQEGRYDDGQYGPFEGGPYGAGRHEGGSYNATPHTGPYNDGSYNDGPYNGGPGNDGSYNDGSYNDGSYKGGPYTSAPYREEPYQDSPRNDVPHWNGPYRNGPHEAEPNETGPHEDGGARRGRPPASADRRPHDFPYRSDPNQPRNPL
jgi:hypothetical protein